MNIGDSTQPILIPVLKDSIQIIVSDFLRVLTLAFLSSLVARAFFWVFFLIISRPERQRHLFRQTKLKEAEKMLKESAVGSQEHKKALELIVVLLQVEYKILSFIL